MSICICLKKINEVTNAEGRICHLAVPVEEEKTKEMISNSIIF